MKIIPLMHCRDMAQSLFFYTRILDFEHVGTWPQQGSPSYSIIKKENIEINLSTHRGDGVPGNVVIIEVQNIDALFNTYLIRGLDTSLKKESPVHQGPLDQTWGTREFYVTDPSGNTLRFSEKLYPK
jgi:catechol 2,3-dioxygenase-like lactoylglutathione lyase family enzyme